MNGSKQDLTARVRVRFRSSEFEWQIQGDLGYLYKYRGEEVNLERTKKF